MHIGNMPAGLCHLLGPREQELYSKDNFARLKRSMVALKYPTSFSPEVSSQQLKSRFLEAILCGVFLLETQNLYALGWFTNGVENSLFDMTVEFVKKVAFYLGD